MQNGAPSRRRYAVWFIGLSLVAVALVSFVALIACRAVGVDEAVAQARDKTVVLAHAVVQPGVPVGLVAGRRDSVEQMSELAQNQLLGPDVVRVKVWSATGTVLYSDQRALIGTNYPLGEEQREVLASGGVAAEVSSVDRTENQFEHDSGQLLEVYTAVRSPEGQPLLFEMYYTYDSVDEVARALSNRFVPIVIGGVLLLAILLLPLGWTLTSRVKRDHEAKEALLESLIATADRERAQIAADLHDGVVQDVTGVGLTVAATANALPEGDSLRTHLEEAAQVSRRTVSALRSLIVEIYPPNLNEVPFAQTLVALGGGITSRGIAFTSQIDDPARLSASNRQIIYRCAREALQNVVRHSEASAVSMNLAISDRTATLTISDNGVGLPSDGIGKEHTEPHFGITLMRESVEQAGGTFQISGGKTGTTVRLEVPL